MKPFVFSFFLFLTSFNIFGQIEPIYCLAVGGTASEYAVSTATTIDGGSIMGGYTNSYGAGSNDCYFVKLDGNGIVQWTKTVGGAGDDRAYSVVQTSDGGYAFTGVTQSFGQGGNDVYIGKLNSSGSLLWTKTIGGAASDYGQSIIQTADGGLAVVGWYGVTGANIDIYFIKMDASGNLTYANTFGGSGNDAGFSVYQNTDQSFVVCGYTDSYGAGQKDCYVLKIASTGTLSWSKTIGGTGPEEAYSIIQSSDGGFVFAGVTQSYGAGGNDCYAVKLDATGNIVWTRTIGGIDSDYFKSIIQNPSNEFVACGWYGFGGSNYDLYFVKISSTGNVLMNKTAGSVGTETGQDIAITSGGYYLVAGYSDNIGNGLDDVYLVKFDASGNICSGCNPGTGGSSATGGTVSTGGSSATGGTVSTGGTIGQGGTLTNVCTTTEIKENTIENNFSFYPNPANETLIISLNYYSALTSIKLFDLTGKLILSNNIQQTTTTIINLKDLPPGMYILEVNGKKSKLLKS